MDSEYNTSAQQMVRGHQHPDLRRALLDEALVLADEVGIDNLSLRELAVRVGVTHPAAYHYFATKVELLGELAREGFRLLDGKLAAVQARSPKTRFVKLGKAYVTFARNHPVHFRLMFREAVVRPVWDPDMIALCAMPYARVHGAVISAGGNKDVTDLAWAAMHGLATLALDGPLALRGDDVERVLDRSTALLASLLDPPTRRRS